MKGSMVAVMSERMFMMVVVAIELHVELDPSTGRTLEPSSTASSKPLLYVSSRLSLTACMKREFSLRTINRS